MSVISFIIRQAERLRGLPWVVRLVFGAALVALGMLVLLRPYDSLTVLVVLIALALLVDGGARIAGASRMSLPWLHGISGVVEIVVAIVVVTWPLISVPVLALVVGGSLILNGIGDLVGAFTAGASTVGASTSGREHRFSQSMLGLAFVIFGTLTVVWPDVSLIIISVAFSARMIIFGVMVGYRAVRYRGKLKDAATSPVVAQPPMAPTSPVAPKTSSRFVLGLVVAGRSLLLVLALLVAAGSIYLHQGVATPSAFYTPPDSVPSESGQLIRSEPYTHSVPDGARGWLILYTTTDLRNEPTVGSAFVMASVKQSATPRDVVLWDHGTQGADRACAPTLLPSPLPLTAPLAALKHQLEQGRVLVGPDYPGMGTPGPQGYMVGENEGRSALDAVRAAHQLKDLKLSDRTVVWGHSQGGQAALWTGALAGVYAPELKILGVAAASPATNVKGLISTLGTSTIGKVLGPLIVRAYDETYADVRATDYIDARMFAIYRAASHRCIPEAQSIISVLTALSMHGPMYSQDPSTGALGKRLDENMPNGHIDAPVFIAQGGADPLVLPKVQQQYVKTRCAAGQALLYKEYEGKDHLSVVADDSPYSAELESWTDDRFAGKAQENICE